MKEKTNPSILRHLVNRTRFGMPFAEFNRKKGASKKQLVQGIMNDSQQVLPLSSCPHPDIAEMSEEEEMMMVAKSPGKHYKRLLIEEWVAQMASQPCGLRERMTLFWHGHFNCNIRNIHSLQVFNNDLRKHALGNFRDLLIAVAKSPAILKYLNGFNNKKQAPNENFARELMELFTLGIGNYTEKDVKEIARAFTGWTFFGKGTAFEFKEKHHDYGPKTIFGQTGNYDGEEVIDLILARKECARFIITKIYKHFVNPVPDNPRINELTDIFYADYDIGNLMEHILLSDWFYAPENQAKIIKSPIELVASSMGYFQSKVEKIQRLENLMNTMGQLPFSAPNVAGWKGGKDWISPHTLPLRLETCSEILGYRVQMKRAYEGGAESAFTAIKYAAARPDWEEIQQQFVSVEEVDLLHEMVEWLLPAPKTELVKERLAVWFHHNSREEKIILIPFYIMSMPEFQLS